MHRHLFGYLAVGLISGVLPVGGFAESDHELAPSMPMITLDARHIILSQIYYPGDEKPGMPRSAAVFYFTFMDCAPCKALMPHFLSAVRRIQQVSHENAYPLRVFMVNIDSHSRHGEVAEYIETIGIDAHTELLLDPYRRASDAFGITSYPHIEIVSPRGERIAAMKGIDFRGERDIVNERVAEFQRTLVSKLASAMRAN